MGQQLSTSQQNAPASILQVSKGLKPKQKIILGQISELSCETNVTQLVNLIEKQTGSSRTSIWYNLRKIKAAGLIDFGSKSDKGKPAKITEIGMQVKEAIENA